MKNDRGEPCGALFLLSDNQERIEMVLRRIWKDIWMLCVKGNAYKIRILALTLYAYYAYNTIEPVPSRVKVQK